VEGVQAAVKGSAPPPTPSTTTPNSCLNPSYPQPHPSHSTPCVPFSQLVQVLPVLPVVVPVLLEALSGLEDARLNYVEQVSHGLFWIT